MATIIPLPPSGQTFRAVAFTMNDIDTEGLGEQKGTKIVFRFETHPPKDGKTPTEIPNVTGQCSAVNIGTYTYRPVRNVNFEIKHKLVMSTINEGFVIKSAKGSGPEARFLKEEDDD